MRRGRRLCEGDDEVAGFVSEFRWRRLCDGDGGSAKGTARLSAKGTTRLLVFVLQNRAKLI